MWEPELSQNILSQTQTSQLVSQKQISSVLWVKEQYDDITKYNLMKSPVAPLNMAYNSLVLGRGTKKRTP